MELSQYIRFFIAFIFVLALIGGFALILRWLRIKQFDFSGIKQKDKKKQLKLTETLVIDGKRRIITVDNDKQEFTILLGLNNDILLSSNKINKNKTND